MADKRRGKNMLSRNNKEACYYNPTPADRINIHGSSSHQINSAEQIKRNAAARKPTCEEKKDVVKLDGICRY